MDTNSLSLKTAWSSSMMDISPSADRLARTTIGPRGEQDSSDLHKAVKEFESYFISYLLTAMRNTVQPGLLPNKDGKQFYSFYDQEIGRLAAQAGGLGLADLLERSLAQGPAPGPKAS